MVISFQLGLEKLLMPFKRELKSYLAILRIKFKAFLTVAFCIEDLFLLLNKPYLFVFYYLF